MKKMVLSILIDNTPGALSRVVGLFSRRGYNIDSLTVGETDIPYYHIDRLLSAKASTPFFYIAVSSPFLLSVLRMARGALSSSTVSLVIRHSSIVWSEGI